MLARFMSDRAKIRNRKVSGNDVQQQRDIANAIKCPRDGSVALHKRAAQRGPPGRDGPEGRPPRVSDTGANVPPSCSMTTSGGADAGEETMSDEADPPQRSGRCRQARRHRRGVRRLRPHHLPRGWRSSPPTVPSTRRRMRRAHDLRDASDAGGQTIADARTEGDPISAKAGRRPPVRLGHRRRHRRRCRQTGIRPRSQLVVEPIKTSVSTASGPVALTCRSGSVPGRRRRRDPAEGAARTGAIRNP